MGNGKDFLTQAAARRCREYVSLGKKETVNGVTGHLITRRGSTNDHSNMPFYSNSSDVYFRQNKKGVCQARVYVKNKMFLDFDWSHTHKNSDDGRVFAEGHVHVQMWKENKDGSFTRVSGSARSMSNAEMKKYGPLLKEFCPNIKLR